MKNTHVDAAASIPLPAARRSSGVFGDYLALTKPRLNFLVVATSAAGYYLGAAGAIDAAAMTEAVGGTALVAGGAAVLNQLYERDTDALMRRTRLRPLPAGRVAPADARIFGATPMKRRTPVATLVGAIPGALPALIGWTASHGGIAAGGAVLFAIVFLWQIPHFMAIAWLYRDDYGKAGFPMLSVIDPGGRRSGRQAVFFAAALVPVSLAPISAQPYVAAVLVLGLLQLALAIRFAISRSDKAARALFLGSITYLPLVWAALIVERLS